MALRKLFAKPPSQVKPRASARCQGSPAVEQLWFRADMKRSNKGTLGALCLGEPHAHRLVQDRQHSPVDAVVPKRLLDVGEAELVEHGQDLQSTGHLSEAHGG